MNKYNNIQDFDDLPQGKVKIHKPKVKKFKG
jgi:hypothetical protein